MTTIRAPQGSYRFQVPETYGKQVSLDGPAMINILPSDALEAWMAQHNIKCTLSTIWETNDLHFNLEANLTFERPDDAIIFKLSWEEQ